MLLNICAIPPGVAADLVTGSLYQATIILNMHGSCVPVQCIFLLLCIDVSGLIQSSYTFPSIIYYLPTPFPAQWLYNKLWFVLFLPFTRCCTPSSSLSLQKARTLRFIQPPIFSSHQNIQSMAMAESNDVFRKLAVEYKLDGTNYPL